MKENCPLKILIFVLRNCFSVFADFSLVARPHNSLDTHQFLTNSVLGTPVISAISISNPADLCLALKHHCFDGW